MREGGEINVMFTDLINYLRARLDVEEGQTMAEYGVVLAVIAAVVVASLIILRTGIADAITTVVSYL
jgi:Flp pilus assembly pilin Flp